MTCEDKIRSDNKMEFYFSVQHTHYHVIDDRSDSLTLTNELFIVTISTGGVLFKNLI